MFFFFLPLVQIVYRERAGAGAGPPAEPGGAEAGAAAAGDPAAAPGTRAPRRRGGRGGPGRQPADPREGRRTDGSFPLRLLLLGQVSCTAVIGLYSLQNQSKDRNHVKEMSLLHIIVLDVLLRCKVEGAGGF